MPVVAAIISILAAAPVLAGLDAGPAGRAGIGLADAGSPLAAGTAAAARAFDAGAADAGRAVDAGAPDAGGAVDAGRALDAGLADAGRAVDAGRALDAGLADAGRPLDGGQRARPGGEAAFLFFPDPHSVVDGTILPEPDSSGPAASMIKYAAQQQVERERELAAAQRSLGTVSAAIDHFFKTSGGESPRVQRDELARLADTALEQGRMAYLSAADHERRRLSWVVKVVRDAETKEEDNPLPGVNLELLVARQAAVRDGRVRKAIDARIKGYRGLVMGIVAWVDGETFLSLEQLKLGVAGVPDLPLAHLYLGYLHFTLENVKDALAEWRKALDLDPANETIKKLIADHTPQRKK